MLSMYRPILFYIGLLSSHLFPCYRTSGQYHPQVPSWISKNPKKVQLNGGIKEAFKHRTRCHLVKPLYP
jgi:hypothetical protein